MRFILIIFIFISATTCYAQTTSYGQIMQHADGYLHQVLPKFLWPAAKLYSKPYFQSAAPADDWQVLEKGKPVERRFKGVTVLYEFILKQTSCAQFANLRALITVQLDSNLALVQCSGAEDIPDFVLNNMPCPFMSHGQLQQVLKSVHVPDDARIMPVYYNKADKRFEYRIMAWLTTPGDTSVTPRHRVAKTLRINAETGDILENTFTD